MFQVKECLKWYNFAQESRVKVTYDPEVEADMGPVVISPITPPMEQVDICVVFSQTVTTHQITNIPR